MKGSLNGQLEQTNSQFVDPQMQTGLRLLFQAYQSANDAGCEPWDFALELESLWYAGVTNSHLRWLLCKGYIEHGVELLSKREENLRSIEVATEARFSFSSCFILT